MEPQSELRSPKRGEQANPSACDASTHPPIWTPVYALAAVLLIQLSTCTLEKQGRMAQVLGLPHSHGSPWLPASDELSSGCCSNSESEPMMEDLSVSLFYVKINLSNKNR